MIRKAYIQEYGNGRMEPEYRRILGVLRSRGIDCELFTAKTLSRDRLPVTREAFYAGDHPAVGLILKKLGITAAPGCYPASLSAYLHRDIRVSTIRRLMSVSQPELCLFIKPKTRTKLFTGMVIHETGDLYNLPGNPSVHTEVYCSSPVTWISEYRVFVIRSGIAGISLYAGDAGVAPDMDVIRQAIRDLENAGEATAGYGIDFGVLDNGRTALVEWNDGYALGAYGLDDELYADLLIARWEELMRHNH